MPSMHATTRQLKPRALVADDHPTNRLVGRGLMHKLGYEVDVAEDGAEAASMGGTGSYDVILMDLNMPVLDGFEASRMIRAQEHSMGRPATPILAVTAWVTKESRMRSREAGIDHFLPKPITIDTLRAVLGDSARGREEDAAPTTPDSILDVAHLDEVGGVALVREAITTFLSHATVLRERLTATRSDDTEEVRSIAHNLKGSCLAVGAMPLARVAEALERRAAGGDRSALNDLLQEVDQELMRVRAASVPHLT